GPQKHAWTALFCTSAGAGPRGRPCRTAHVGAAQVSGAMMILHEATLRKGRLRPAGGCSASLRRLGLRSEAEHPPAGLSRPFRSVASCRIIIAPLTWAAPTCAVRQG